MSGRSWRLALATVLGALLAACSTTVSTPTADSGRTDPTCHDPVTGQLPEWAQAGFSPPDQPVAHLLSESRGMVAVPFGWPLREHQTSGRQNKVLWVSREAGNGPMVIDARREGDAAVERRELPDGPGSSIVDLPEGCWQLQLSWPGGQDVIYLRYLGES